MEIIKIYEINIISQSRIEIENIEQLYTTCEVAFYENNQIKNGSDYFSLNIYIDDTMQKDEIILKNDGLWVNEYNRDKIINYLNVIIFQINAKTQEELIEKSPTCFEWDW